MKRTLPTTTENVTIEVNIPYFDDIVYMKEMMQSVYTYGSIEKGSYDYDRYILPYKEKLGEELFNKIYEEEKVNLNKYEIEYSVYTDSEGLNYNTLKLKPENFIFHFEDWVNNMLNNSDYTEFELMEFEEHYQNLLDFDTNTNNFLEYKQNNQ